MKTRRGSVWRAGLLLTLAAFLTSRSLADGELDPGFNPPPELGSNFISGLAVVGGQAYVGASQRPVIRLREDGSLDEGWQPASPNWGANVIVGLPAGGLAVAYESGFLIQYDDGSHFSPRVGGILDPTVGSVLPQDDGSVTVISSGYNAQKVLPDGSIDPAFRVKVSLQGSNFPSLRGGIRDGQGRYVVIGDFQTPAPDMRFGGMRLLADGSLDTTWNPQPYADVSGLSAPFAITALPEDSVLLVLFRDLVWIDAGGTVTRRVPNLANNKSYFLPPIVQPDGKIIVAGNFDAWNGESAPGLVRLKADGTVDPSFSAGVDRPFLETMKLDARGRLWFVGGFSKVNGVDRPGIARIQAYTPPSNTTALTAQVTATQAHVATNEVLYLTAQVNGQPEPTLQWLRDGTPIPGATNRGLRLSITNGSELGAFSLVLSNDSGSQKLEFPSVTLAARSPHPGSEDMAFSRALTNFNRVNELVPMADGRILVASENPNPDQSPETALVGRLLADGSLDASFGQGGVVAGRGRVETLIPLPDGGLLVAGEFTDLGGQVAYGLAELDRSGKVVVRPFPNLDIPHVSTALPLPDGKLMIAGRFAQVNGVSVYRLARLNSDLTLDTSFQAHLLDWQFVDALALDAHGRVLIAGERVYAHETVTNPPLVGLQRLLPDGSPDPAFHVRTNGLRAIFMEPEGQMLVGMPPARLDEDGNVLTLFEDDVDRYAVFGYSVGSATEANHLMARTAAGGVVYPSWEDTSGQGPAELWRWKPTGERDFSFQSVLTTNGVFDSPVTAMAVLADDSILLTTNDQAFRLRRIPRDSDLALQSKGIGDGQFHVSLATQPGLSYEIYRRDQLTGGTPTQIGAYSGDGYVIDLQTPATGNAGYLELRRQ